MAEMLIPGLLILLLAAVVTLAVLLYREKHQNGQMQYQRGYHDGQASVRDSVRYEQEIFDCRRAGVVRRETVLKVRERVLLGNLKIAETEREVVLDAQVDLANVWQALDYAAQLPLGSRFGSAVSRLVTPAATKILSSTKKP